MRMRSLSRYLRKWQQAGLIGEEQSEKISEYMRLERHKQFLKLFKVLFVVGALWLFVGIVATLRLINVEIFVVVATLLYRAAGPVIALARALSPEHYKEWLCGILCLAGWGFFQWLGAFLRKKSKTKPVALGDLQAPDLRLGTASFTLGYILAAWGMQFFNYAIYPKDPYTYLGREAIFPVFSFVGTLFFLAIAYAMRDQIALLFGICFLAHTVGIFTTYFTACYVIGVQFPAVQLIVGLLLVFVGLYHIEKVHSREDRFQYGFGRMYESAGLIFIYLSLWIMSIWGMTFTQQYWIDPKASEIWIANILFLGASLGALFYGARTEDRLFFNYGLTFLLIDTYTLFFSHVWSTAGSAAGSLALGVLMIGTGYALRRLWLNGRLFRRGAGR